MNAEEGRIGLDIDGAVATITLDRPAKANAMTTAMAQELHLVCKQIDIDDSIRCIVLTGNGRTFSAGSDISSLDEYESAWAFRNRVDYCDAVLNLRKPIVAAINGAAFGGGLEMAVSCDVRFACPEARFAAPEVGLGWIGGGGASQLLPRICGAGHASRILLSGEPVDAETARSIGLVQEVVDRSELLDRSISLAKRIASNAPIATQSAKAAVRAAMSTCLEQGMQYEEELVAICMGSADRDEGIAAFFEKRQPRFRGR